MFIVYGKMNIYIEIMIERGRDMSFASETKKELTQIEADNHCMKAEVSALIRMNGSLSFANKQLSLDVQTENAAIARRLYTIMKKLYPYNVELLVRKKMRLKKITYIFAV